MLFCSYVALPLNPRKPKLNTMKNILLIILTFFSLSVFAQKFISFPKDSAEWFVKETGYDGDGGGSSSGNQRYFVKGDTIINDISYIKVYKEWYNDYGHHLSFASYLYQDSLNQKVYIYQPNVIYSNPLLFDFGLEVRDSVNTLFFYDLKVEAVDSIYVQERYHKVIWFDRYAHEAEEQLCFIEGIGSNAGLFPGDYLGIITTALTCFRIKGESVYPLEIPENGCELFTSIDEQNLKSAKEEIKIYPNPFSEKIHIDLEFAESLSFNIKIMNILGQTEYNKSFDYSENIELITSNLVKGIYLLSIEQNNKIILKRSLIKQ